MPYSPEFKFNNPEEITGEPEYLTQEGFKELQKKLDNLRRERSEIANKLEEAIDDGDLTENAAYQGLKNDQGTVQNEIDEIEAILGRAVLIRGEKSSKIQLGSAVTIQREGEMPQKFNVLSHNEANPAEGKISDKSPLGLALMGKKKGNKAEVLTQNGKIVYNILEVE